MNNFNPLNTRGISPFSTAGSSFNSITSNGLRAATNKFTLSGLLNGAQKTIGTVNQIVPLYNQVKPLFQNSKILINVAKSLQTNKPSKRNRTSVPKESPPIDVEPIEKEKIIITTKKSDGSSPSKPFFI